MRALSGFGVTTAVAALALALTAWLGLRGHTWGDWKVEARPSVDALLGGHIGTFFRTAPVYGASLLLRAPFMALTRLWGGGGIAVYTAGAAPCLAAEAALALWLGGQLQRRGCGLATRAAAVAICIANPLAVSALQIGHPEELLGAVLCVAAVLCAQRDRPIWSGVLVGLAIANKDWGVLAAGPALLALPRSRGRSIAAMLTSTALLLAPFVLVAHGGFVGQTNGAALNSSSIFGPLQLWWFLGSATRSGARLGPTWLAGVGHTLPIAIMVPLALAHAARTRRTPARRRRDAMLLLALLLLLRCVLDPWDVVYYPLPFLTALLAWETTVFDRFPLTSLAASLTTWFVFGQASSEFGLQPDALATVLACTVVPAIGALGYRLLGPTPPAVGPPLPARRPATGVRDVGGQLG